MEDMVLKQSRVAERNQSYESYKDSGVEWLGMIPKHWKEMKVRFVFNLGKGLTITKLNLISEGILCVNYGEIHSKYGFELDTTKHILKCVDEEYLNTDPNSLIKKGDFVFADTSEDIDSSGNFTHLRNDNDVFAGYHTVIARPKNEIISLFFAFVFDSLSYRNQIRTRMKGVKVYSITQSILKDTIVWFPPLPEQTAIANFLDDKTTKIDIAIAQKEKMITLLKERKQIMIQDLVTGKKVWNQEKNTWTKPEKVKDSGVEWIGEIPEGWEVSRLKNHIKMITGYPFKSEKYTDEGIKLARGINVKEGVLNWNDTRYWPNVENHLINYLLKDGDILIAMDGSKVGKNFCQIKESDLPILLLQRVARLRTTEFLLSDFLYYNIVNRNFLLWVEMTKTDPMVPHIAPDDIKNFQVSIPPLSEQKEISEYIESTSQKIDTAITLQQQQIEKLKELKSTLIDSAVTGKIKVSRV